MTFEHVTAGDAFADYLSDVKRSAERIERLEQALDGAVERAPSHMREVIAAVQSLRGVGR